MTVIAWDGKTLAADKRALECGYGSLMSALEVQEQYGVPRHTFHKRVVAGWDPTEAATAPVQGKR